MDNPGPAMIELYKELGEETPGYECPYTEECFSEDHEVFDNGNNYFPVTRSMLQRERYYRLPRTRSCNGSLRRKPNRQKKPAPENTPGWA